MILFVNSIWDCPEGSDEQNCASHTCSHLFKCRNQSKCLPFSKVCNAIKDCIFGDDELSCISDHSFSCPLQCFCFAQSIVCDQLTYFQTLKLWDFINYFKCYNCTFAFHDFQFFLPINLNFLDFKNYLSADICMSKFLSLRKLDMSYNMISTTRSHCFRSLLILNSLYLHNNIIFCIENKAFHNLRNLKILDLSYNRINMISEGIFTGLHTIKVVNLTFNLITRIYPNAFNTLPQNTIHSLNRQVCCMSGSWLKCTVQNDQFINCNALLSNKPVSYTCFSVGTLAVLLNLISTVVHIKLFSQLQTNKFFTLCLSLVDCLNGLYLLIISSADWYYRGYYAGAEFIWKQSFVCHGSSFITSVSFIASPIILFVMMFARFRVVQWPMTSKFKCEKFSARILYFIIIAIVSFCFIVLLTFLNVISNHMPNRMCLFMYSKGELSELILFMFLLVICIQIFCLTSNIVVNLLSISLIIKQNKSGMSSTPKQKSKYNQIFIHLVIVICVNMCCWIPSVVVFILFLTGYKMSSYFFMWIIIVIVPINSIADPILFSILTPTTKRLFSRVFTQI